MEKSNVLKNELFYEKRKDLNRKIKIALGYCFTFLIVLFMSCESESDSVQDEQQIVNEIQSEDGMVSRSIAPIDGQYIVVLKKGSMGAFKTASSFRNLDKTNQKQAYFNEVSRIRDQINRSASLTFDFDRRALQHVYAFALEGFSVKLSSDEHQKLLNDPRVERIYQDYEISISSMAYAMSYNMFAQDTPWGISRVGGAGDGTGKTAWVIDTGIDLDHPDLNVDVSRSVSFVTGDSSPDDGAGHGTHVAGTIAAIDNGIGVVGVAAGATVVSMRVLDDSGTGAFSWTVSALDYVTANGSNGDVANMSLGPSSRFIDSATDTATQNLAQAGVKIAIAAGNEYDDCSFYSPARNNHGNIYTVSALADGDFFVYFSNYGTPVDYIAPGYQVLSTYRNGGYAISSGTSMASPHMAGILLLGNPTSDGTAQAAYWEVRGRRATGNYSATNIYRRSAYRPDPDGNLEPIAHR